MAKRIDNNQSLIVRDLRKAGAKVQSLADIGKGCPDLLVAFRGLWHLLEVKDENQPPSKRRLTTAELDWIDAFKEQAPIHVVMTSEEALKVIGAIK